MTSKTEHTRLLKRQLKKTIGEDYKNHQALGDFIELVNNAYLFNQEENELYRRAEDISAKDYSELNKQLIEKNDFLDTFNHGLAHDIKNHSANIIGLVYMLKKYIKKNDPNKVNQIADKLEGSSNQLMSIVQGFLHLSQAESDIGEKLEVAIDKEKLIDSIEREIAFLKNSKQVEINYNIDNVIFSESTLKIILVNLISNSIKYSKPNEPAIVNINVNIEKGNIYIKVKDNGVGMDVSKNNKKLFNLFNQTHNTKGHGVGLFLVKKIAEKNNGKIEIDSEINVGTTIKITFNNK